MKLSFYRHQKSTPYVITHLGKKAYFKTRDEAENVVAILQKFLEQTSIDSDDRQQWEQARKILAGVDPLDAARFYAGRFLPKDAIPTVGKAVADYLADQRQAGRRPKYMTELARSLRNFAENHSGDLMPLVSAEHINSHLLHITSDNSRHDHFKHLHAFFRWAWRRRYVRDNPCGGVHVPSPTRRSREISFLTVNQSRAVLEAALEHEPATVPFFALQFFCGIRTEEIMHLDWPAIDLVSGIHLRHTKSGVPRVITWIPNNVKEWLHNRRRKQGLVVPRGFRKRRDHVVARATHDRDGHELFTIPQNCLRHTFATYACAYHETWEPVIEQMGHRNARMLFEHYRNHVTKEQAIEFFSIIPSTQK